MKAKMRQKFVELHPPRISHSIKVNCECLQTFNLLLIEFLLSSNSISFVVFHLFLFSSSLTSFYLSINNLIKQFHLFFSLFLYISLYFSLPSRRRRNKRRKNWNPFNRNEFKLKEIFSSTKALNEINAKHNSLKHNMLAVTLCNFFPFFFSLLHLLFHYFSISSASFVAQTYTHTFRVTGCT